MKKIYEYTEVTYKYDDANAMQLHEKCMIEDGYRILNESVSTITYGRFLYER